MKTSKKKAKKTPKAGSQKSRRKNKVHKSARRLHVIKKFLDDREPFKLEITMAGETYNTEAPDLFDALMDFKPEKITSKLVLRVERGEKHFTRFVMPMQARRLFANAFAMKIFIKGLETMLQ